MDYVIGCDVGSQGVKVVLLSVEGQLLGEASAGYAIDFPHPTWAEQSAEVWLAAIADAIGALKSSTAVEPDQTRAIGLDAQVDGVVPVDAAGQPLRSAIIWMDRRAVSQCEAVAKNADPAQLFHRSGLNLDPSHVAPKIRWLADTEPDVYARTAHFLLPGSYVAYALTGELAVDYSNASSTLLMDVRTRSWSRELCECFRVEPDRLALIRPAPAIVGKLRRAMANERSLNPYDLLDELAASAPPGSEGLLLLPCLMGAMAPTWNAAARGTFFGFTLAHRREHFVRAVLEASAYAVRDIVDQMRHMGLPLNVIRAVGGGARSRLWRQIKADVTGLPVALPQTTETTALGAAMLALVGVSACATLAQAAENTVRIIETLDPQSDMQARYEDYYQLYRAAYFALLPVFEQAARIPAL